MEEHIETLVMAKDRIKEISHDSYINQNRLQDACQWLIEGVALERGWKMYSQNHRIWLKTNGYFKDNGSDYIVAIFAGDLPKKPGKLDSRNDLASKLRAVRVKKVPTNKGIIYLVNGLINSVNMSFTSHFFDRYKERCMKGKGSRNDAIRTFFIKEYFTGMCGIEENQKYYDVKHTKVFYKNGLGMGISYNKTALIKTYVSNAELTERNIDLHKEISEYREEYESFYQESCKSSIQRVLDDRKGIVIDKDLLSAKPFSKQLLGANND